MIFNLKRPGFGEGAYMFDGSEQPAWASEGADWMMSIPVSGTLTIFAPILHADLLLVAGGKPGAAGAADTGGNGGNGGGLLSLTDVSLPAGIYTVTIGGSGEDTVLVGPNGETWTAVSGQGKAGAAKGQTGTAGDYAWNDPDTLLNAGWRYGASGGHGATHNAGEARTNSTAGGSVGTASTDPYAGHGGGIEAYAETHPVGWDGAPRTGQGGGGGRGWYNQWAHGADGGAGGSGNFLLRNHKEAAA